MTDSSLRVIAGAGTFRLPLRDPASAAAAATAWNRCLGDGAQLPTHPVDSGATAPRHPDGRPASGRSDESVAAVTAAAINAGAGDCIMFHAAGLSDPVTGATVALVAPSGTGKTTAVAALATRLGYVTDETVIIDPQTLEITPFPKPLSLLGPDGQRPKTLVSPDELGLLPTPANPYLAGVVVLDRDPAHDADPVLQPLSLTEALEQLVPQTSSLAALDRGLVQLAAVLDRVGGSHVLRYREVAQTAALVEQLAKRVPPAGQRPRWEAVELPEGRDQGGSDSPEAAVHDGWIARARIDDALIPESGTLAILHRTEFTVLQGIGPMLWEALPQARPVGEVVAELATSPGAPSNAAQVVQSALRDLLQRGLLRQV